MGFLSKFEGKVEDTFENAVDKMFDAPISPVQIAKKAEKQMRREKMVGAGKQYAPTLYTILVNPDDDDRLFGYYPTLAGETETYLTAKASESGLVMDGQPLVRFIVDDTLKHGKFDVIAEAVAAPIIRQLRAEEMERYGIATPQPQAAGNRRASGIRPQQVAARPATPQPIAPVSQPYGDDDLFDGFEDADYAPAPQQFAGQAGSPVGGQVDGGQFGQAARNDDLSGLDEYIYNGGTFDAPDDGLDASPYAEGYNAPYADEVLERPNTVVIGGSARPNAPHAQPACGRLIDRTNGRSHALAPGRFVIGRVSSNDIVVPDANASRMHAELSVDAMGRVSIEDLGSTNGTHVNGRAITSANLYDGDRITIGMTTLVLSLS